MLTSNSKTKSYFSYGLNINSFIHLPDLVVTESENNVKIRPGNVRKTSFYRNFAGNKILHRWTGFRARPSKDLICLEWDNVGACLVKDGSEVIIELNPGLRREDFIPYITGPIFGVLLHQRQHLVLHASAVRINNRAVIFLGNKGYGKSTLAAHLQLRGHQLISDDLVPVSWANGKIETLPGHPQIRLFPDSVESVGMNPRKLALVNSQTTKRQVRAATGFSTEPVEIGCIFVLSKDEKVEINELGPASAFIEIARNTYLNAYLEATENTSEHFRQSQDLVKSVPVFLLKRPHDFGLQQEVVEQVENQVSKLFG